MRMPIRSALTSAFIAACAVGLAAQSGTTQRKEKTKIEIKDGKDVTLSGCLQRSDGNTDYVLANEFGALEYAVVTDDDLSKYVDRRVEVKGKAADRGDAKVRIDRKVEGTSGNTSETKVEQKGDTTILPYLGLKSIKSIAPTCR